MIYRDKILAALDARRGDFARFNAGLIADFALYREAIDRLSSISFAELMARLSAAESPGALPTSEFDRARSLVIPFGLQWSNHEEARKWAYDTLLGRTTFAADGSQIFPTKDVSVPVAAVQVAWFENSHTPDGAYTKDASFEVLAPGELTIRPGSPTGFYEQAVHFRRYRLEIAALKNYMISAASRGTEDRRPPVVFFDSLLVISFAETFSAEQRGLYVSEVQSLLDTSLATGIPLVGYIDTTFARDLSTMLKTALDLPESENMHDASLLSSRMSWGDRTPLFQCARSGILASYSDRWQRGIGFVYLKTAGDGPPARLDLPLWVYERGLLEYVVDTVRAEVIAGNGYPYAIETADATAVLTARDRELFYGIFQDFAQRERIGLRIARKAISKAMRR
jgi:hypothetical protein